MRARWMVWVGLIVPAAACCWAAILAGPGTASSWAFIALSGPAAAAGVGVAWTVQERQAKR